MRRAHPTRSLAQDKDADKKQAVAAAAAEGKKRKKEQAEAGKEGRAQEGRREERRHDGRYVLRPEVPLHRPRSRIRPRDVDRGESEEEVRILCRRSLGRRLEDRQRRHDMDSAVRWSRVRIQSAGWNSIRTIRPSYGSDRARAIRSAASPTATAFTSPTTAARIGRISG